MKTKRIITILAILTAILASCSQPSVATPAATPTLEVVVNPTQVPTQEPTTVVSTVVPTQEPTEVQSGMMSLLDTIKADERLSLFYEALTLSGAVDILKGKGPFTVFAPTNDAIKLVPNLNSMEQYGKIISNHIVSGKIMTADLPSDKVNIAFAESGNVIAITIENGVLHLHLSAENAGANATDVMVITADIETSNGVLFVVDTMLLP